MIHIIKLTLDEILKLQKGERIEVERTSLMKGSPSTYLELDDKDTSKIDYIKKDQDLKINNAFTTVLDNCKKLIEELKDEPIVINNELCLIGEMGRLINEIIGIYCHEDSLKRSETSVNRIENNIINLLLTLIIFSEKYDIDIYKLLNTVSYRTLARFIK